MDALVAHADEQLGRAGVVLDKSDVPEVEPFEELGQQVRDALRRQVGARAHRPAVAPHRQDGDHDPEVGPEAVHHCLPHRLVEAESVHQHHGLAASAGVRVLHDPGTQFDLMHRHPLLDRSI